MNQNNYTDTPEWLHDWRIRQEAERQRLQELDISHPGAPLPEPPSRPPKRPELGLKVNRLPTNVLIIQFNDVFSRYVDRAHVKCATILISNFRWNLQI